MYQVPQHIDKNKIFIVQRSEIEGRLDPKVALYNRKVQNSLYPKVKLKDVLVCKPQYGASEPGVPRSSIKEPRFIRITDIDENGLISHDELGATAKIIENKYILCENDILIARSGATVGKAYIHKPALYDCFFAGYLIRFIINTDKALPEYIFTYTQLNAYKEWVNAIQRPSGQPNINSEEYQSLEIPLPNIERQQVIVDVIKSAYLQKKQKESEAKKLLDSIDTYILNELGITIPEIDASLENRLFFTSFKDVTGSRLDPYYKLYFSSNYKSVKYDSFRLGSITNICKGTALTSKDIIPGNIPVIAGGKSSPYSHNEANFDGNVITVSASGAYAGYVWYHQNPIFATDCSVISSKDESLVLTSYIAEVLKSIQSIIYRLQVGAAQPHVYPSDLMNIYIPSIPISQQKTIVNKAQSIRDIAKKVIEEGNSILENAKKEVEQMIIR